MSSSKEYVSYILEQLSPLGAITCRPMMGEYVLYYQDKVIGGIYDNRFLIKAIPAALALMPQASLELPYSGAKAMLLVEQLEDMDFLQNLFTAMYEQLPPPKKKNKSKGRSS